MGKIKAIFLVCSVFILASYQNCSEVDFATQPKKDDHLRFGLEGDVRGRVIADTYKPVGYNITYLIDVSLSISSSNMQTALNAFRNLTDLYDKTGFPVNLTMIRFGDGADIVGSYKSTNGYATINNGSGIRTGNLKNAYDDLNSSNGAPFHQQDGGIGNATNYSAALELAQNHLSTIDGNSEFTNIFYFFTDGEPNGGAIRNQNDLQAFIASGFDSLTDQLSLRIHSFGVPPIKSSGIELIKLLDNTTQSPLELRSYQDLATILTDTVKPGEPTASGKLSLPADVDPADHFVEERNGKAKYGNFTVDKDGKWEYELDNQSPALRQDIEAQASKKALTDTFTVKTLSGERYANVVITIQH